MDCLLIIDLQKDFVDPGGALYFKGAEKVVPPILKLVEEFKKDGKPIVTTQDWHDPDDEEFKIWPKHCVAGEEGAELTQSLKEALVNYENHYTIKKKRYSAFYGTNFDSLIKEKGWSSFTVCGVVTNICVLFTVEELRNRDYEVRLFKAGVASFDDELHRFALREMMEILKVEVI